MTDVDRVRRLLAEKPHMSNTAIAQRLGIPLQSMSRIRKRIGGENTDHRVVRPAVPLPDLGLNLREE